MKRSNSSPPTDDRDESSDRRRMQIIIDMALEKFRKSKLQKQTKDNGSQDEDKKISSKEQTSNDNRDLDKYKQSALRKQKIPDRHDGDRKFVSVEPNYNDIALEYCRQYMLQSQIEGGHKKIASISSKETTTKRSNSSSSTDDRDENRERRRMQIIIDMALEKYRKFKLQKQTKDNGSQDEDKKIVSKEQKNNDKEDHCPDTKKVCSDNIKSDENSFPYKLYDMLQDSDSKEAIAWTENGDAFRILDHRLLSNILSKYFEFNSVTNFKKHLDVWDFSKLESDQEFCCYKNEVNNVETIS